MARSIWRNIKKRPLQTSLAVVIIVAVVCLGTYMVLSSHAATSTGSLEGESGSPSGGAAVISDTKASGGKAVQFNATATAQGLSVSGNHITKNGVAFVPHGFNMIGVLSPPGCTKNTTAAAHLNAAEFSAARNVWHANTVRFQVSQSGLAGSQSAAYITNTIKPAVVLAHAAGLEVIISMQDQSIGCGPAHPLPSAETVTAWAAMAPVYKNDPLVMYELFNEPQNDTSSAGWNQWKVGGSTPNANQGSTAVGMQQLVNDIRGDGASNILIADGANYAGHLDGVPILTDTLSSAKIAYGIHPYYYATSSNVTTSQGQWDLRWGNLSATEPVLATEWNYMNTDCGSNSETQAKPFLDYMTTKGIGVFGHALDTDIGTGLIANWSFNPTDCSTSTGGGGLQFYNYSTALPLN